MELVRQQDKNADLVMRRGKFLTLLQTGLSCHEYQFCRQACLIWLATYPGDLLVNFVYASVLAEMGDLRSSAELLEQLIAYDPEFTESVSLLDQITNDAHSDSELGSQVAFLQRSPILPDNAAPWLAPLVLARQAYESGHYATAEKQVLDALAVNPANALPAILHMQVVRQSGNETLLDTLANIYSARFHDSIQIKILTAMHELSAGDDSGGVEKLHWSAAHDVAGQVATRLLGQNHAYRLLWPEDLKVVFDLPVPANITAALGTNVLGNASTGAGVHTLDATRLTKVGRRDIAAENKRKEFEAAQQTRLEIESQSITQMIGTARLSENVQEFALDEEPKDFAPEEIDYSEVPPEALTPTVLLREMGEDVSKRKSSKKKSKLSAEYSNDPFLILPQYQNDETVLALGEIQAEFDRMAKSLNKSELVTADGRFPNYVLLTSRLNLENKYGANTATVIIESLHELALKITSLPNWNSLVLVPDDAKLMGELGLPVITNPDAWKLKGSLTELDKKLSARGEMIGALLIVGGHEIVPFHILPNPTDDSDLNVPTDNPYATLDENYFVQQWPVGRIPDEKGKEAVFLLEQLRYLNNEYAVKLEAKSMRATSFLSSLLAGLAAFIQNRLRAVQKDVNLGCSAEVWKLPSSEVYAVIDKASALKLSPPTTPETLLDKQSSKAKYAYFNLHGLKDAPEWYGQRDFRSQSRDPEYPIALTPSLFDNQNKAPELILSEACYGANILDKKADDAICMTFLATGARAFVGSTCIAYGSVAKPLIAADLLAHDFWTHVQQGVSVGYALMRAKMTLARNMTANQGYLDGEDQKTILSFVLYGDPLASRDSIRLAPKPMLRPNKNPSLKTISDSPEELVVDPDEMPDEIVSKVRKVVNTYMPGLDDATMTINPQLANFGLAGGKLRSRKSTDPDGIDSQRYVVTLKKSYQVANTAHDQFARMTFDKKGDMVKLSASR